MLRVIAIHRAWLLALGLFTLLWLPKVQATPGPADDPFAAQNKASEKPVAGRKNDGDDPFAPANQTKNESVTGSTSDQSARKPQAGSIKPTPIDDRIDFEIAVNPQKARRGEIVKLTITGVPREGYHTYPLTMRSSDPAQDASGLSTLRYQQTPGLQPLWPVKESSPQVENVLGVGVFQEHKEKFTWEQDILILRDAKPGIRILSVTIKMQVCNGNCVWGEPKLEVPIEVTDAEAVPLTRALQDRLQAKQPPIKTIPVPGGPPVEDKSPVANGGTKPSNPPVPPSSSAVSPPTSPKRVDEGLFAFMLQGVGWGFVSLLTPCVFPMIPITVSFFLKQSQQAGHRAIVMASVYSWTIIVVLTVGGVLLIPILQPFSQHWTTNLVLGALFLVFALSLFGMYEIQLPASLANFTSSQEARGGLIGTMFMALTFTIISFTCVAPFYGGFILFAATAQSASDWLKLVLGAFSFSVAFASPFFVLALFPSLLRSLPKSGSWMNSVKVVMGFLELAAALKFLRASELNLFARAQFFTYDLVLGMYIALAILCGLYLLSLYRLPHDHEAVEQLGVPRLLFSLVFLSLGFYLMPGLFKQASGEPQRPKGTVFAWLDSFLLPEVSEDDAAILPDNGAKPVTANGQSAKRLSWIGNLDKGLEVAKGQNKLVFIDFTGLT